MHTINLQILAITVINTLANPRWQEQTATQRTERKTIIQIAHTLHGHKVQAGERVLYFLSNSSKSSCFPLMLEIIVHFCKSVPHMHATRAAFRVSLPPLIDWKVRD